MDQVEDGAAVKIAGYLPAFFLDTDFLNNGKMLMLTKAQRHDFFAVLSLKRGGYLDKPFPCMEALDRFIAKSIQLGKKAVQRLKKIFIDLNLIDEGWQPKGWNVWQSLKGHKRHNAHSVRDIMEAHEVQDDRKAKAAQANRERVQRCRQRKEEQDAQTERQGSEAATITQPITGITPSITPTITGITPTITGITPTITCNVSVAKNEKNDEGKSYEKSTSYSDVMVVMPLHIHSHEHPHGQGHADEQGRTVVAECVNVEKGVQGEKPPTPDCAADCPANAGQSPQSAAPPAARPAALPFVVLDSTIAAPDCEQPAASGERQGALKPKKRSARAKKEMTPAEKPDDVCQQVWDDFLALRDKKNALVTVTALNGIAREAQKANLSLQEVLEMCCMRGWQGFNASWVANANPVMPRSGVVNNDFLSLHPNRMTAQERVVAENDKAIAEFLAQDNTIEVQATEVFNSEQRYVVSV